MRIQVGERSYRTLSAHLSIEAVADLLSLSKECVQNAIKRGYIPAETSGEQVMIPADFVEKILFGEVDQVNLPLESQ